MAKGRVSRAAKAKARRRIGPLAKKTVAPQTRKLYDAALDLFKLWLKSEGYCWPRSEIEFSDRLMEVAGILWEEGESKADLANLLSAFHDAMPAIDPWLRGAWRLYHVWKRNELAEQSTPAKEEWVHAMAGLALHWRWPEMALIIMLTYWCLLRTAEAGNLLYGDAEISKGGVALLQLGLTKGGKRRGRSEAVILDRESLVNWLEASKKGRQPGERIIPGGAKELRRKFAKLVSALGLTSANLRYYSLRRGGATATFYRTGSFDACAEAGRWGSVRTARIYIDAALQTKYEGRITDKSGKLMEKSRRVLSNFLQEV